MKQITLLLFFMCSLATYAQDEQDFIDRTVGVNDLVKLAMERRNVDSYETMYVVMKANTVKFVNYTDEQKPIFRDLFTKHANEFQASLNKIAEEQTEASGIAMIQTLLKHEDEFRKVLTQEQLKAYLAYFDDPKYKEDVFFKALFFSDQQYNTYKKELKM